MTSSAGSDVRVANSGFTLVEVLVVLTIMSVLMASISFAVLNRKPTLNDRGKEVVRQLRIAQQQAIRNDRPVQVEISVADNAFRLADEVIQLPVDIALTVRTAEDQLIDSGTVGMSFYPDASASGGRILLESETETFEIEIVWITGMIATQHKLRDA